MAKKSKKYMGVYTVKGKRGVSYGVDYTHPQTGQRVRKILKDVTSEAQAFEIRTIELADASRGAINKAYGIRAKAKVISFEAVIRSYLEWSEGNKKSPETDKQRATALLIGFKGKLISDINPFMVEKYKMIRAKMVSKKTVNKELSLAGQALDKAVEWGHYNGENPFLNRFKIKKDRKPGALTVEDVLAIQNEITHPVKRDMVGFAFFTGWRISEICKLKWEDIDFETGRAWIVDPKNSNPVEIELDERAFVIIKKQKRRSTHVFCRINGTPYKGRLQRAIRNAAKRAGVELPPRKAWHIFRRTWASNMLQGGCDVETLRVLGNWKDCTMPLWYAEAAGTKQRKAALAKLPDLENESANGRNKTEIDNVVSLRC